MKRLCKVLKILFCIEVLLAIILLVIGISTSEAASVRLAWNPNTDVRVTGYRLYVGYTSRTYQLPGVDTGKVTEFPLTGIEEGKNIFFAVTAHDAIGNESDYSIELPCWTLVPSMSGSGSITPSAAVVVSAVNSQTFNITPAAGSYLKDVLVDGVSVGQSVVYTFSNPVACHTIKAIFETPIPVIRGLKIVP